MERSKLDITDKEAAYIKGRFKEISSYANLCKSFPLFCKGIDRLPCLDELRSNDFLDEILVDCLCEARGLPHGSITLDT